RHGGRGGGNGNRLPRLTAARRPGLAMTFHESSPLPNKPPARFVPEIPFPPYSYVTGRSPHPTSDPAGHSFGHLVPKPLPVAPADWRHSREYLLGCDLFNFGYYWEAHEVWEALWQACGRAGTAADFLKGLIKLAAAGVKVREGRPAGVARHAARAGQLFGGVLRHAGRVCLGLDVARLIAIVDRLADHVTSPADLEPVEIVFDFHLLPAEP
ncbi:MAG TPA: DUF309 domain-containing protein, partial [Pirellulales bacterium]|nr:DUF309 domain-containing protein [Pirellulales bacterium]